MAGFAAAQAGAGGERGPITGLSKRQQRLAKVEPTEESKDKAASEITKAVGELEQMEKGSMREKPAPKEDEDEEDDNVADDNGATLSAFGQRQKLNDMEKGVAGRFGTRAGAAPTTEDASADDDDEEDDKKTYDGLTAKLSALESSKKTAGDQDGDGADKKTEDVAKGDVRKSDAADKQATKAGLASTPSPKADGEEAASARGAHKEGDAKEGETKTKEPEKKVVSEASSGVTTAEAPKKMEEATKKIADMRATLLSAASQVAAGQGAAVNASLGLKSSSVASSAAAAASPGGKKEGQAGESTEKTTGSQEEKSKSSDEKKEKSEEVASATDAQAPAK
jgi:hypothetical protein